MKKRTLRKRLCVWRGVALLSLLFTVAVGWIVFDNLFSPFGEASQSVEIPDFCGQNLESLAPPDWAEVSTEYRYDAGTPAGEILSQTPPAGSFKKLSAQNPRCAISLVVSLGEETMVLPDLSGQDARAATAELRELGLAVETVTSAGAYPAGTVFAMEPRAGTELPVGARVVLSVSSGPAVQTVTVPDVCGLSRSDALMQLWLAQLTVGDVVEEFSDKAEGTVIRQSHQPGTLVTAGTKVTLYVSRIMED